MDARSYEDVLKLVLALSPEDRRRLLTALIALVRADTESKRRPWRDVRGTAPYPALGEDAQVSITRTRDQWSDRERIWSDAV